MKVASRFLLAPLVLALLSSCGGGGGGAENPGPSTPYVATPAAVTPANQVAVAQAAVAGSLSLALAQPLAAAPPSSASTVRAAAPRSPAMLLAASARRVLTLTAAAVASSSPGEPRRGALATTTETEACGASGSITTTFDDRDNSDGITVGDAVTVAFGQCRDSTSESIDGTVAATITSLGENTPSNTEFAASLVFRQVTSTFGTTSGVIDGTVDAAAAVTASSFQLALTVGSSGLGIAIRSASFNDDIAYAPGMRIVIGESEAGAGSSTVTLEGSFSTRSIGGSVTVATPQPFRQAGSDDYPSSGQMLVTGAAGSRLRVTALDRTQLRLELDANGDGSYEASRTLPWSTLSPG